MTGKTVTVITNSIKALILYIVTIQIIQLASEFSFERLKANVMILLSLKFAITVNDS